MAFAKLLCMLGLFLSSSHEALAEWGPDGLLIPGRNAELTSDGLGGAYVTSSDTTHVYFRRVTGRGEVVSGYPAVLNALDSDARVVTGSTRCASDGESGAFVAWAETDPINGMNVWLSRVLASGDVAWRRLLGTIPLRRGFYTIPPLVPTDSGDVFVGWVTQSGNLDQLRLTRIRADGWPRSGWGDSGVAVDSMRYLVEASMDPDGVGGIVIGIRKGENDTLSLHRFDPNGGQSWLWQTPLWELNWGGPRTIPDRGGGVFVTWITTDGRQLRLLHLDASGGPANGWDPGGRVITPPSYRAEYSPIALCPDASGGALLVWSDLIQNDLFAQHILSDGAIARGWEDYGRTICAAPDIQESAVAIPDGTGGMVIGWEDWRYRMRDIIAPFAMRVNSEGVVTTGWSETGTILAGSAFASDVTAISDGTGGAIVSWSPFDDRLPYRIQRIRGDGVYGPMLGKSDSKAVFLRPFPDPFTTRVECDLELARATITSVVVYDITGRRVATIMPKQVLPAGSHRIRWNGLDRNGTDVSPGVYFFGIQAEGKARSARFLRIQ